MNLSSLEIAYAERYRQRNAFYLAERDRVLAEMPEADEIQTFVGQRREPLVAVCGTTQVGKTTLILKLMGVSEEQRGNSTALVKLGKALRGNTRLVSGEGGTPTAITYRWSDDGRFHLRTNLGESTSVSTLAELEKWLQGVRDAMKAGDIKASPDAWYRIEIPRQFAGRSPHDLVLVDTPGKDVHNRAEVSHLEDIYRGIVATATLVIFVEHSNKIARLPHHVVPGLGGLREFSDRCALVLTHAFSERTFAMGLPDSELTPVWIQAKMAEEIREVIEWDPANLFPLEYGQTWHGILIDSPKRATLIRPVIEKMVALLHERVAASLHPDEMVRQFLGVERQIVTLYDRRLEKAQSSLRALEVACSKVQQEIEDLGVALAAARCAFTKLKSQQSLATAKGDEVDGWPKGIKFPTDGADKMPEWPPSQQFTDHLTSYREKLAKYPRVHLEKSLEDFLLPLRAADIDIDDPDWSSDKVRKSMIAPGEWTKWCHSHLDDWDHSWFFRIHKWRSEAFGEKRKKAVDAARTMLNGSKHFDGLVPFLRRTLREQIEVEIARLEKRLRRNEATIQDASDQMNSLKKKRKALEGGRSETEVKSLQLEEEKERCTALARRIPARLLAEFGKEKSRRMAALGNLPVHEQIADLVWLDTSAGRLKSFLNT